MKKRLVTFFLTLTFLAGVSLMLYPTVSNYWNSLHTSTAVAVYDERVRSMDEQQRDEMWEKAVEYNASLAKTSQTMHISDSKRAEYESVLDVDGTGMMGYIEIPNINISLPIYHGTENAVLQIATGHLEWTSLPVGGTSSHCVISGHRGLPSAKLFTNLDQLKEGDTFVIRVLNEVLTYEVDQIRIVLPVELNDLQIERGKDYCTLVTCTPYGVNSHRLLVRGHRVENESETIRVTSEAIQIEPLIVAPIIALPILIVVFVVLIVSSKRRSRITAKLSIKIPGGEEDEENI
ncbi:MAG: class C sortase [Huintestinicola sp.]